jgi:arylsulfatase A-like enzyme
VAGNGDGGHVVCDNDRRRLGAVRELAPVAVTYCPNCYCQSDPTSSPSPSIAPTSSVSSSIAASRTGAVHPGFTGAVPCRRVFEALVAELDANLGRIEDALRARGVWGQTLHVAFSDNGGQTDLAYGGGNNNPLRGGKASMYVGGIRVPFIVLGPGVKAGSVSTVPVTGLDFLPTMAELAGYQPTLPATIDGGSMTSVLRNAGVGEVKRQRPYLIFHQAYDRNAQSALRWGDLKLVKTWKSGKLELFDLSKDLSEANDLSAKMPEKTKELDQVLTAFLTEVKATTVQTKIGKDE